MTNTPDGLAQFQTGKGYFDVVFDLPQGQVSLLPPGQLANVSTTAETTVVPITELNGLVWLDVLKGSRYQS